MPTTWRAVPAPCAATPVAISASQPDRRSSTMDQEKTFGDIEFSGRDVATPSFPFDRLAISGRGELLLVSLVAPAMNVKQIRAILNGGAKVICNAGGVKVKQPSREDWYAHAPGRLTPSADGYF